MKILALERELQSTTSGDYASLLIAEAESVWRLYQQGVVRELYFNAQNHTAVVVLECDSLASAKQILSQLALVEAGMIDFDLVSLAPYDGFARLFVTQN